MVSFSFLLLNGTINRVGNKYHRRTTSPGLGHLALSPSSFTLGNVGLPTHRGILKDLLAHPQTAPACEFMLLIVYVSSENLYGPIFAFNHRLLLQNFKTLLGAGKLGGHHQLCRVP